MKITKIILAATIGLMVSATAQAAAPVTDFAGDYVYLGAKLAVTDHDDKAGVSYDKGLNIGVYGGVNLLGDGAKMPRNLGGGTLSVEGEFTLTVVDGDTSPNGDWDVTTLGAYAAYRFPVQKSFYLKARAGGAWTDVDAPRNSQSHIKGSFGIGAGFKVGSGEIEPEINVIGSDLIFLSIGYIF